MQEDLENKQTEYSRKEAEQIKIPKVDIHMANFFPWTSVVSNKALVEWTERSGADQMEWIAAGPVTDKLPIGPTHEVLSKPVAALQQILGKRLASGHVIFNPYASFWGILGRREDPLRPGEPIAAYNLILSNEKASNRALKKLELVKNGKFPVVVYPPFNGNNLQEHYKESYLQIHPAIFNDLRNADEIIKAIKKGAYSKVCIDTFHFQQATDTGLKPFGNTEKELFETLEKFYKAGVLGEIHVQPGRVIDFNKPLEKDKDLKGIFGENPSYNTQLGRMLKFLIHDLGFMGPYTVEIDPRALINIYGKKILLPPGKGKLIDAQATAIDYVKRA